MIKASATLIIDMGNSETRVATVYGKTMNGVPRLIISKIPNSFAELPEGYEIPEEYKNENSIVFNYKNNKPFTSGELCEREFPVSSVRPTAIEKKYEAFSTELTLNATLLEGYRSVAKITGADIDDLDISWKVVVLLPPADMFVGAKQVADKVRSIKSLNFIQPDFTADIDITEVNVYPESLMAFMGVVFGIGGTINSGMKNLLKETILIIDIGAGTTDFCVVKNSSIIEDTKETVDTGGNNVHQKVRQMLKREGLALPDKVVQEATVRGTVKDGSRELSIVDKINDAKEMVASALTGAIRDFFESTQFPARTIEKVLVVGGGSMTPKVEGIKSMSEYLVKYLHGFAPNADLVEIPQINIETSTGVFGATPRELNVLGALVVSTR